MTEVISYSNNLQLKASVMTVGAFDGVHRGHQKIIERVVTSATSKNVASVIYTFDPPPKCYFSQTHSLTNLSEKILKISSFSPDFIIVANFDELYASRVAIEFCRELTRYNPRTLWLGNDFQFGAQRMGDIEMLQRYFDVQEYPEVKCENGERISSSRLRALMNSENTQQLNALLGWGN